MLLHCIADQLKVVVEECSEKNGSKYPQHYLWSLWGFMAAGEIMAKMPSFDFHIPQLMNLHSAMLLGKKLWGHRLYSGFGDLNDHHQLGLQNVLQLVTKAIVQGPLNPTTSTKDKGIMHTSTSPFREISSSHFSFIIMRLNPGTPYPIALWSHAHSKEHCNSRLQCSIFLSMSMLVDQVIWEEPNNDSLFNDFTVSKIV